MISIYLLFHGGYTQVWFYDNHFALYIQQDTIQTNIEDQFTFSWKLYLVEMSPFSLVNIYASVRK